MSGHIYTWVYLGDGVRRYLVYCPHWLFYVLFELFKLSMYKRIVKLNTIIQRLSLPFCLKKRRRIHMWLIKTNLLIFPENILSYIFISSILKKTKKLLKTSRNLSIGLKGWHLKKKNHTHTTGKSGKQNYYFLLFHGLFYRKPFKFYILLIRYNKCI